MTVTVDASGRYHASFVVDVPDQPLPLGDREVGIDLGLTHARNILAAGRADRPTLVELVSAGTSVPQPAVKREPAGSTA